MNLRLKNILLLKNKFSLVLSLRASPLRALVLGHFDGHDLLRNDGQNLKINSVELVEAAPASRLRHPREELAQHFVVQALRTVEHHTLLSHCLKHDALTCGGSGQKPDFTLALLAFEIPRSV